MAGYPGYRPLAIAERVNSGNCAIEQLEVGQRIQLLNYPITQLLNQAVYNPVMLALALTGVVSATAAIAAYQSVAPTGDWYGKTFTGLAHGSRQLALTYDDGPNDPHTQRLLEILARHGVRATFFLIGRYVRQRPEIVRELVQAGHILGNHTL